MARIDILLPVRNGLPYLGAAIDSIRRQSVKDWRLLILDHGSSDGSTELAARHADAEHELPTQCFRSDPARKRQHADGHRAAECERRAERSVRSRSDTPPHAR